MPHPHPHPHRTHTVHNHVYHQYDHYIHPHPTTTTTTPTPTQADPSAAHTTRMAVMNSSVGGGRTRACVLALVTAASLELLLRSVPACAAVQLGAFGWMNGWVGWHRVERGARGGGKATVPRRSCAVLGRRHRARLSSSTQTRAVRSFTLPPTPPPRRGLHEPFQHAQLFGVHTRIPRLCGQSG